MGRLIEWNLISLDGYFEGAKKWDLEWHNYVWDAELEKFSLDQLHKAGMLLFGRTTYRGHGRLLEDCRRPGRRADEQPA